MPISRNDVPSISFASISLEIAKIFAASWVGAWIDCERVFGIGCSFTESSFAVAMPKTKRVIHATLDPDHLNKDLRAEIGLVGDAGLTLDALIAALAPHLPAPRDASAVAAEIKSIRDPWLAQWMPKLTSDATPLSPYRVLWDLMHTVDVANTIITHDAGSPRDQLSPFWQSTTPLSYIGWGKTTQLGYGLGLAMGAKLVHPDKLCINVWGDAAIGFTGMDFETAVRERIPILSILLNNFSMAIELKIMAVSTEKYRTTDISGRLRRHGARLRRLWRARHRPGRDHPGDPARHRADQGRRACACSSSSPPRRRKSPAPDARNRRPRTDAAPLRGGSPMSIITRRATLAAGAGLAASAALPNFAMSAIPIANVEPPKLPIENGATLRILRPTKFVDPDEVIFRENVKKFTDTTKVPVRVDFVGWEDLRPQTAVAANTGAGPDVVIGWPDDPHLYSDKLLEVSDVTEYLGKKYGGWYFLAEKYGKKVGTNNWIAVPMGGSGGPIVYRQSWVKEAGFDTIPNDMDQFLTLCRNLKKNNHPVGFSLGNAVGDANGYCSWLLWAFGGYMVDEDGHVAINRKETIDALKYAKEMYPTMIDGVLSWGDPSNNKAYIAEQISLTANGVSIYFALKNDPKMAAAAADTNHQHLPTGPVGKSGECGAHPQRDGVQAHQVPERGEGVPALHDGAGAVREVAHRHRRLLGAAAESLCRVRRLEGRPQDRRLSRHLRQPVLERLQGPDHRRLRRCDRRLRQRPDVRSRRLRPVHAGGGREGGRAPRETLL